MDQTLTLEDQLCFSIYATSMAINRLYKPMLDGMGITYPQYLVLNVLWEQDGRRINEIAARLDLDPSTITPLVKRIEAAGLVNRTRRLDDERSVQVTLTPRGRGLQSESRCLSEALSARAKMPVDQMISLNREMRHLHRALTGEEAGSGSKADSPPLAL
ncbi:MarR family winged helix-turn-helix transcriptional regulator [Pseudosulfitobacter pseudonitzschiae]|uniref:MarR family winged helix-turn-helix transcriptional regulator n=1 Tax=Pseudosulfitobacter pseudonitzschiae TaxID=1402135 RepID=UPI001AF7D32E|nr:MarR family transcriptional regulator [Pseudosulfitobacter pseudonitzschiae]MBM1818139.1 MarR family transcriptional regulator [Pseudosulfitobacter pseudonitzschiae]MBM1835204.1 MarR family transcriptional regulator [Pseudosulfitobacter pseudonitzschiae]MBM1840051.1 MarR family transcriptional regulator [Pseudosulfitobacter pseudonitzschiae]MBM1844914.1 MarR family transcriptional regulator [Pseudosulfitobacter pseudonitzschiae]MBM1849747.1 MarR family transcriptional regulator [Pseudosulfi